MGSRPAGGRQKIIRSAVSHVLGEALCHRMEPYQDEAVAKDTVQDVFVSFWERRKMPDNMRKSFLLRLDNLSTPDIAKRLNLAEQTVSNLLTEASKRLRKNLPHRFHDSAMPILIVFLQVVHDLLTN